MKITTQWKDQPLAFLDTETTGTDAGARIVEIALRIDKAGKTIYRLCSLVNPGQIDWQAPSVAEAMKINGIDPADLKDARPFSDVWPGFQCAMLQYARIAVGHFIRFDQKMLEQECSRAELRAPSFGVLLDTMVIDHGLRPGDHGHSLAAVAERWGVTPAGQHRADKDVALVAEVFYQMVAQLPEDLMQMLPAYSRWYADYELQRAKRELKRKQEQTL